MPKDGSAKSTDSDLLQVLTGLALAIILTLVVLSNGGSLSWSTGFYLILLSCVAGGALWWGISVLRTGAATAGRFGGVVIGGAAVLSILVVSLSTTDATSAPPAASQAGVSEQFGVEVAAELTTVPTLSTIGDPSLADVDDAGAVAVPIIKVAIDGSAGRFLIRADLGCRVASVLLGPPAGGSIPALVAVTPPNTAAGGGGDGGADAQLECGANAADSDYQVIDVDLPVDDLTGVADVGAGGPASLVDARE